MARIKLTKEQRQCLKVLVEQEEIGDAAFVKASMMIREANKNLWQKIQKMWPDAIRIEHPNRGDWIVTTKEKD